MAGGPGIVCFGAANMDVLAQTVAEPIMGSSNPSRAEARVGGVAANVAMTLAKAGERPALVTCVGDDVDGRAIRARLEETGVDCSALIEKPGAPTGRYLAVEDGDGRLIIGAADARAVETLTSVEIEAAARAFPGARLWFAETNLPANALASLIQAAERMRAALAFDLVSVAKAARLHGVPRALLSKLSIVFCNLQEARSLLRPEDLSAVGGDAGSAAAALWERLGEPGAVVVTNGPDPVAIAGKDGRSLVEADPLDTAGRVTTGAGDALIAGALAAFRSGKPLADAVAQGRRWAAAAIARDVNLDLR